MIPGEHFDLLVVRTHQGAATAVSPSHCGGPAEALGQGLQVAGTAHYVLARIPNVGHAHGPCRGRHELHQPESARTRHHVRIVIRLGPDDRPDKGLGNGKVGLLIADVLVVALVASQGCVARGD